MNSNKFMFDSCEVTIINGPGSQGTFLLVCSLGDNEGHNFFYDIDDEIDCFDEDGYLKADYKVQLSFTKLGYREDILLFFSIGDGLSEMMTKVYCVGKYEFKMIGKIIGQAYMDIDYSLNVHCGGQGCYDTYVYCDGEIMRAQPI